MSNDNRCVACGRIIPEGRQICPLCEAGGDDKMKQLTIEEMRLMAGQPVYCKEEDIFGIIKIEEKGTWKNKPFLVAVWHEHGAGYSEERTSHIQGAVCKRYPKRANQPPDGIRRFRDGLSTLQRSSHRERIQKKSILLSILSVVRSEIKGVIKW